MDTKIIMQIVEESKAIPDEHWGFPDSYAYRRMNGKHEVSPLWKHVLNHPEIEDRLQITFEISNEKCLHLGNIDKPRLPLYLDIAYDDVMYLFYTDRTKQEFVDVVTEFVSRR